MYHLMHAVLYTVCILYSVYISTSIWLTMTLYFSSTVYLVCSRMVFYAKDSHCQQRDSGLKLTRHRASIWQTTSIKGGCPIPLSCHKTTCTGWMCTLARAVYNEMCYPRAKGYENVPKEVIQKYPFWLSQLKLHM